MNNSEELQKYWDQETEKIKAVLEAGGISGYASSLSNYRKIWEEERTGMGCIDERVHEGVGAAGSLILVPLEDAREFCNKAKITYLVSHAGCGAAAVLYRKENNLDPKTEVAELTLENFAKERTARLADELGLQYKGHLSYEEMAGSKHFHTARSIYYIGLPHFTPHALAELPTGFVIERVYHTSKNALVEVELVVSLIKGEHGYGELITKKDPIYIYVVASSLNEALLYMEELQPVVAANSSTVRLEPFIPR